MRNGKAVAISGAICAATAGYFWTQSRIPQLGEKAMMGGRAAVASLSFGELVHVEDAMPLWRRIVLTAVNWGNTNWRGMTFGLLFAAAFLTLLGFVLAGRKRTFGNVWLNTLGGVVVGAPLGLCANCATPVGRGMHAAGLRSETALAALFSSPTLNPIVLTMLFTLFPLYVAATKLALTLGFILIAVPLITRALLARSDGARAPEAGGVEALETTVFTPSSFAARLFKAPEVAAGSFAPEETSWLGALRATAVNLLGNLAFILEATLPLMVVAGFLGAALVQLVPLQHFLDVPVSSFTILGAALVGTFLPVPIAFDVLAVAIFVNAGLPVALGVTLLFTLGLFSVYPFLVIWRAMSRPAAVALYAAVVLLGVLAGHVVWLYDARESAGLRGQLGTSLAEQERGGPGARGDSVHSQIELARQRCASLGAADRGAHCLSTFVLQRVGSGESRALCDALPPSGASDREACRRDADLQESLRSSLVAGSSRPCEKLALSEQEGCRTSAIEAIARNDMSRMLELCAEFGAPDRVRRCRREGVNGWVANRGDATLCENLDNSDDAASCARFAEVARAVLERRPEACQALAPPLSEACMRGLVDTLMKDHMPDNDPSGCAALGPFGLVEACTARWVEMRVKVTGNASWCDRLPAGAPTSHTMADCREWALIRTVERELAARDIAALRATTSPSTTAAPPSAPVPAPLPAPTPEILLDTAELRLTATAHAPRVITARGTPSATPARATRFEGAEVGITHSTAMRALDVKEPFAYGRGVASGDVDGDGRPDLVFATSAGFALYLNRGEPGAAPRFVPSPIAIPEVSSADAFVVALVDLDRDGWLDLFLSAYGGTDFIIWNDQHSFAAPHVSRVPSGSVLTMAAAFGDLDGDGLLDVVLGNWSFGAEKAFIPERSKNLVLLNRPGQDGRFEGVPLPEVAGETLSVLLTDLDGDGRLDLLYGNDHDRPDQYYLGEGGGHFRPITPASHLIPSTPMHTMSIDSADLDNDGRLDLFATDMSFSATDGRDYCAPITGAADRARCALGLALDPVVRNRDLDGCRGLDSEAGGAAARAECTVMVMVELAQRSRDESLCERIPAAWPSHRAWCANLIGRSFAPPFHMSEHLPQKAHNALLMASGPIDTTGGGALAFKDRSKELGVDASYWSWNARAFDLDDDGWQDVYVGNGFRFAVLHPNVLFHNEAGKRFTRREGDLGLGDALNTPSFTVADLDGDGDLDLVATAANGPVRLYRNEERRGHALSIALRDERGNRLGVGARVTIGTRTGTGTQVREIKAGGGFLSFDPPIAHFGLGGDDKVTSIEVRWPTGEPTRITRELPVDRAYVITRKAEAPAAVRSGH